MSRTYARLYFNPHIHLSMKNFRHDPISFYLPEFILPNSTQIAAEATQVKVMSNFYVTRQSKKPDI